MERVKLDLPIIGVSLYRETGNGYPVGSAVYHGVSYCDAARRATYGEDLVVAPGSVEVCKWAPPVLGLKSAEGDFEKSLEPRMDGRVTGYRIAPLGRFTDGEPPDVVILRGPPAKVLTLIDLLGRDCFACEYEGHIGRTALGTVEGGRGFTSRLVNLTNRALAWLRGMRWFDAFTRRAFKSELVTRAFERVIRSTVADMSMCRNSTVIPYLTGRGNVSFFCAGGVTWGDNSPSNVVCGLPFTLFEKVEKLLEAPAG